MRGLTLLPVLLLGLFGCSDLEPKTPEVFFNMDSLVNAQVDYLSSESPVLIKSGEVLSQNSAENDLRPDSSQWNRELAVFRRADINKPRLREAYSEEIKSLADGTTERAYLPKKAGALTVKELIIIYEGTQLQKIEARISDQNPLYASERMLHMEFIDRDGSAALSTYSVTGRQQMKFKDSVTFSLNARVVYD